MSDDELMYERTPEGQMLYDFGFSDLTEKWLAQKYKMPISKVKELKKTARIALGEKTHER